MKTINSDYLEPRENDLQDAISHYNSLYSSNYCKSNLIYKDFKYLNSKNLFKGYFEPHKEEGWLDTLYGSDEWIEQMEYHEHRPFKNVINNYLSGEIAPIIIINDVVCDGYGRIIFYHAIGRNVPAIKFILSCQ